MFGYEKLVWRTAWDRFKVRLFAGARQVVGFILQTTILFAILFYQPWFGDVQQESRMAAAGIAAVLLSSLLSFLWDLFRAPAVIFANLSSRVEDLERKLAPRFSVIPTVGQRPVYPAPQHVSVTVSGKVQSNRSLSEQFLCIEVTNNSASTLRGCEAYLSRFERVDVDGEESGWHSTRLAWMPAGETGASVDIPPLGVRSVMIFKVLGTRPLFLTRHLPGDLVHYLQDKAEYQGLVTLTADGTPATFVAFTLSCDAPEREPTISVMRRNFGEEPDDFPWAPERHVG